MPRTGWPSRRELEQQYRYEQEREKMERQERAEQQRLKARERELETERQRQEEEKRTNQRILDQQIALAKLQDIERQKEKERAQRQADQPRRTVSVGQLHAPDSAIFDFADDTPAADSLQSSGASHPNLHRGVFGLNRALSPPKASTSAAKGKPKAHDPLMQSATNLQAAATAKAAMRMQSTLKGAFTPMNKGSPTRSESSKSSSSRHGKPSPTANGAAKPLTKALSNGDARPPPEAPPKLASAPSLKGKEKADPVTQSGRPFVLVSDSDEEWTSADEDEDEEEEDVQVCLLTLLLLKCLLLFLAASESSFAFTSSPATSPSQPPDDEKPASDARRYAEAPSHGRPASCFRGS